MIYFLYGDTPPLQIKYTELVQDIKNKNKGIVEKVYDASQSEELDPFYVNISTNSIFAPKELIILKRAESIKKLGELFKGIQKYDTTKKYIIIVYEEFLNEYDKPMNTPSEAELRVIGEMGEAICYRKEKQQKDIKLYVQKELNVSQGEADDLIDKIGDDFFKVKNEIDKIKIFLDGSKFSLEKVLPLLSLNEEYNLRQLMGKFITTKDPHELLMHLNDSGQYMSFIYMLSDELLSYLKMNSLTEGNKVQKGMRSFNEFKSYCYDNIKHLFQKKRGQYAHPYVIFLKLNTIGVLPNDFIKQKLKEILVAEYNVKSGNMDENIAVETLILNFFPA